MSNSSLKKSSCNPKDVLSFLREGRLHRSARWRKRPWSTRRSVMNLAQPWRESLYWYGWAVLSPKKEKEQQTPMDISRKKHETKRHENIMKHSLSSIGRSICPWSVNDIWRSRLPWLLQKTWCLAFNSIDFQYLDVITLRPESYIQRSAAPLLRTCLSPWITALIAISCNCLGALCNIWPTLSQTLGCGKTCHECHKKAIPQWNGRPQIWRDWHELRVTQFSLAQPSWTTHRITGWEFQCVTSGYQLILTYPEVNLSFEKINLHFCQKWTIIIYI